MTKYLLAPVALAAMTISASAFTVLNEPFTYADGFLTTVSGGLWSSASGTANQMDVLGGVVNIVASESEDTSRLLAGPTDYFNAGVLTATFTVNFSALPTAAGTYFAHLADNGTGFRARLFAQTANATSGFRLAIADTTTTVAQLATDLSLNTNYSVTLTYDVATGRSSFAVGGISGTVTAVDATTPLAGNSPGGISSFRLRQAAGEGTLTFDNLLVDATVAAVPEPSAVVMAVSGLGFLALLRRRRAVRR
jgi:hypothetical protein